MKFLKAKTIAKWIGFCLGIGILVYQFILCIISISKMEKFTLDLRWLIFAIVFSIIALFCQIFSWTFIMKGFGILIPIQNAINNYVLSFIPRYIPGTIWGYLSRNLWLEKEYACKPSEANIGSILEIGTAIIGVVTVSIITNIGEHKENWWHIVIYLLIIVLVYMIIVLVMSLQKNKSINIRKSDYLKWHVWFTSVIFFIFHWICNGLTVFFLSKAISIDTIDFSILSLSTLSSLYGLSWLIGLLAVFIPAGLGIRELSFSVLLQSFGLLYPYASLVALLMRLISISIEILFALLGLQSSIAKKRSVNH